MLMTFCPSGSHDFKENDMEEEQKERPREEGHTYVHTVPDLPYKKDAEETKEEVKPKRQTKVEFGLTWD
jgi:hypothetical protein